MSNHRGNPLRQADEVNLFPSLELVAPVRVTAPSSSSAGKSAKLGKLRAAGASSLLPGLLKTGKTTIAAGRPINADDFLSFVGFNATHVYFDGESIRPRQLEDAAEREQPVDEQQQQQQQLEPTTTVIDMSLQGHYDISRDTPASRETTGAAKRSGTYAKVDPVMDELRNYAVLLDKFSLHNFMIYNGQTLRDTPEFHSFRRTYNHEWGAIAVIVAGLEKLMREHSVKLAIINGKSVYDLASLNLVVVPREDLVLCISNIDQVKPQLKTVFNEEAADATAEDALFHKNKAAVICQALIRRFLATCYVQHLRRRIAAATMIQSVARRMVYRRVGLDRTKVERAAAEERWATNRDRLSRLWQSLNPDTSGSSSSASQDQQRLVIHIPSLSAQEYLRLDTDNLRAMQNSHIACLSQLADPDVTIVYITPCIVGPDEQSYHDRFLAALGINTLPKRLHFVVPEMLHRLPQHLSLTQLLWCSSAALRKLKNFIKRFPPGRAYVVPGSVGWMEKKIAHVLNVPILSPNPSIVETIKSRSYLKKIFANCQVNIPIGAHDIFSLEDLLVALSRLVASNLHVRKWLLRLNHDCNNESVVVLDTNKLALVSVLRAEQKLLFESSGGQTGVWFTKNVQLSVRKRLLEVLTLELAAKLHILRRDVYPSWEAYSRHMQRIGAVIEAEPIEKLGYVDALCFIEPTGEVAIHGGVDVLVDDKYQAQTHIAPQTLTPTVALEGASQAVCRYMHDTLHVVGYVTLKFCAFWDGLDNVPRLWAQGAHFGMTPAFGASATACIASDATCRVPRSLMPFFPEGKFFVHVPIAVHPQLRGSRDDVFFKLCRMRGISFDPSEGVGTLFFLVDTIVGGAVSVLCVANSRFRALEQAVQCLSFITTQFGKEKDQGKNVDAASNLCSVLLYMRRAHKAEAQRLGPIKK